METETRQEARQEIAVQVASQVMGWTQWANLEDDCPNEPGVTYFAAWDDFGGVSVYPADETTGDPAFYFNPAKDIGDAWEVIKAVRDWPFSKRQLFKEVLREAVSVRLDIIGRIHHGEVLLVVEPVDICRAALAATTSSAAQPKDE